MRIEGLESGDGALFMVRPSRRTIRLYEPPSNTMAALGRRAAAAVMNIG
jgi:hypothetical protein